ncbi:MAG: BNR repeat-like domain-containing protein/BNR/Asp-box repeat-containing protein [Verrucomicrobia bacterium]|jgi:BNR repeat-like domain/BNR/Asp-box repeat|nr:MAG: BNR repeat-like domain-containing protein/BNR/Asp-box repeat-containing protein [Verrucomicrobiota bacterium]
MSQSDFARALAFFTLLAVSALGAGDLKTLPYAWARFVMPPGVVIPHEPDRVFIGPGTTQLPNGDILLLAPWGSAPAEFQELRGVYPLPNFYRSTDNGRTWTREPRIAMDWKITGTFNNGGFSFLRLMDGRLALVGHRYVPDNKGGGLPIISYSSDNGASWKPARIVGQAVAPDDGWYIMNDRLIQLNSGRLLIPVAHAVPGSGPEGDLAESGCFYSDDNGATWKLSQRVKPQGALRGMAEPCVAQLPNGHVLMLARSGTGYLVDAWSQDGGVTWSPPQNTALLSPCTSLTLKTLPDGRLIVFYNHVKEESPGSLFPRCPLVYAVSTDGKTWGAPVLVDDEGWDPEVPTRENIYPSICFVDEGMLVVWSSHFSNSGKSRRTPQENLIGGGKRAILSYPTK